MPDKPASWFELSAPSAFIGFLVLVVGVSNLLTPERVLEDFGHYPGTAYIWNVGYAVSGVMTLVALAKARVDWEVYSIVLLLGANLLSLVRTLTLLGLSGGTRSIVIFAGLMVFKALRARALLRGGTFVVPKWTRE